MDGERGEERVFEEGLDFVGAVGVVRVEDFVRDGAVWLHEKVGVELKDFEGSCENDEWAC